MPEPALQRGLPRAARAVIGAVFFAVAMPVLFRLAALVMVRPESEMRGWVTLALTCAGVPVGGLVGLLVSAFGRGESWERRCWVTLAVLAAVAVALAMWTARV